MSILTKNLIEHPDQAIKLLQSEKIVMEMIAMGSPLPEILKTIALNYEENSDGAICSILLMDDDGIHVKHGAGPSLPDDYNDGINGEPIGPVAGSCGTAAYKKERVIVRDITTDPLWVNYRDFALQFGLKACWSTPILTQAKKVLGTFSIYYREIMVPDSEDLELIDRAASQVKIALERYNGEKQIKESELRHRTTLERITDGFVALDNKWRFTYINKKAGEIFNLHPGFVLGKVLAEVMPEGIGHPFHLAYEKAMKEQKDIYIEEFYAPHEKWYENHIYPSPDGFSVFFRDITDWKKSNAIIKESEEKYRTLVEQAADAIFIVDLEGHYLEANESASVLTGYDVDELIKMNSVELIAPGDLERNPIKMEEIKRGEVVNTDRILKRKDGELINVEIRSKLMETGKVNVIIRDVTKRMLSEIQTKESEEKYRTLIEQASDSILITDSKGAVTEANAMAEKILGYSKEELVQLGMQELIVLKKGDPPLRLKELNEGKTILQERKVRRKDGSHVAVEFSAFGMQNGNHIAFMRDITKRKKAQQALAASENRLRAILESEPECVKILNKKGEVMEMNPAGLAMVEADNLEMVKGKALIDLIEEPYKKAFGKLTKDVFSGESGILEFEITALKGKKLWLETHSVPLKNSDGKIVSLLGVTRNITDRKLAEFEILESKAQFQNMIENIPGVYWVNNLGLKQMLYVSPSYESIWGRKCDDLYENPMDFIQSVHPNDLERIAEAYKNIDKTLSTKIEYRIIKPDGEIRWIAVKTNVVFDRDGQQLEYGYAEDVTNSRLADDKLNEERNKIANIGTTIDGLIGSFRIDPDGKSCFPYASDAIMDIYGFSAEQAGKDANQIMALVHPDDKKGMLQSIDMSTKTLSAWKHEYRYLHPIKGEIWLEGNFVPIRESTGSTIWHGVIMDISERKAKERERQSLLVRNKQTISTMLDGFILADERGKIIETNQAYASMVGYSKDELVSLNINDIEASLSKEEIELRIATMMEKGSLKFETTHKRKDHAIVDLEVSISIMEFDKQPLVAAFVRDITERKKAREELEKSHENLRELAAHLENIREEERAALSRELHDELGQQLTAIKMDLSWLNKRIGSDNSLIDKIDSTIKLTNEAVFTVRRINSDLRPTMLDDLGFFAALEYQMNEFGSRYSVQCQFDIEMEDPKFDRIIEIAIFRVFQEALTNIGKHAKAKKIHASIRKVLNKMELSMVDDGVGFDTTTVNDLKSFGLLGMRERAMMINGVLEIDSKPGIGTSIKFVIPLKG